jgi:hypothetical protein
MKMRWLDPEEYLKRYAYKDEIPKFKDILGDIGKGHGWTLEDLRNKFSNKL